MNNITIFSVTKGMRYSAPKVLNFKPVILIYHPNFRKRVQRIIYFISWLKNNIFLKIYINYKATYNYKISKRYICRFLLKKNKICQSISQ